MKEKLYLLDGTAIIYRAFYSMISRPLRLSDGFNTSSIYGTCSIFLNLVKNLSIKNVLISFDERKKTFRHRVYPKYKANRQKMPEELAAQIEPLREFFRLCCVKSFSLEGFEADDVLASVAQRFKKDFEVVIVSSDKDFAQLLGDKHIVQYDPIKNITISEKEIVSRYKVAPSQFIDYLALVGDSSDNIPGVRGIGPKSAAKLLSQYPCISSIYEHIDEIEAKALKSKLLISKEDAFLSFKLAQIKKDIPVDFGSTELCFDTTSLKNTIEFAKKYQLFSIVRRIEALFPSKKSFSPSQEQMSIFSDTEKQKPQPDATYRFKAKLVETNEEFFALLKEIQNSAEVAVDTETTSLDTIAAKLVGIALCCDKDVGYYIPLAHRGAKNLDLDFVVENLKVSLKAKTIIGHNLKYDISILKKVGLCFGKNLFDTMVAAYLLDPRGNRFSLENLFKNELGFDKKTYKQVVVDGGFEEVNLKLACDYSSSDAVATYLLYKKYLPEIESSIFRDLFYDIELPLIEVLAEMEKFGVFVSTTKLAELQKIIEKKLKRLIKAIFEISDCEFNINSTKQLAEVLFGKLQIKPVKKGKTGYSTDVFVLQKLAGEHKIAQLLLEYRQLTKLSNTYVSALPKQINPLTGRIHSSFRQTITTTGRLSSTNPNLQNIPIRSELGKRVREAFVAPTSNYAILSCDYSQIELRILAILSKSRVLINAFSQNLDIHLQTAKLIFGSSDISATQRNQAKTINFGIIYGMGSRKLAAELGISYAQANEFIANYFEKLPDVAAYIQSQKEFAKQNGYAKTLFGRRLILDGINSRNNMIRAEAERVAVNMPIQGTAADVMKLAMINIHNKIKGKEGIKMVIQVHDELVFEIEKSKIKKMSSLIKTQMESVLTNQPVKLVATLDYGHSWRDAH